MRKLAGALVSAIALVGAPALARDNAWYLEADAGVTSVPDNDIKLTGGPARLSRKAGLEAGMITGYDLGKIRVETEFNLRRSNFSKVSASAGFGGIPAATSYSGGTLRGHTDVISMMMNGLADLGEEGATHYLLGGGVGIAQVRDSFSTSNVPLYVARKAGFAWQLMAGVSVPMSANLDVGFKYRYFDASGADRFADANGRVLHDRYRAHSLLATMTHYLGSQGSAAEASAPSPTPAAPPPPPAPSSPPPPPPAVCNKGPYIVFFDWDSAVISGDAASVLDSAVQGYGDCGQVPVMIAGYADRSGSARYNLGLSARRDAAVKSYLVSHGIPASTISSHAFGEANPRVPTPDGVRELQNRRVEITYGPGSGN